MTKSNYEQIVHDGKPARLYPDGSVRNDKGHWLVKHPGGHEITEGNASSLAKRSHERKHQVIKQAANEAVQRGDLHTHYGDMAFLAEVATVAQEVATTPDHPRVIQAAQWLVDNSGMGERQQEPPTMQQATEYNNSLLRLIEAIQGRIEVIDVPSE